VLQLSKSKSKRKKGVAIATAQLLFHIDPNVGLNKEVEEIITILNGKRDLISTAYGWTTGEEVAKLISEEGLDTEEVKRRILHYRDRKNLTEKKNRTALKNALCDYMSNYCHKSESYEEMIGQIQSFPKTAHNNLDSGLTIDNESVKGFIETLTEEEKRSLLRSVNRRIDVKTTDYARGTELEKYLNDIGLKYGIDCTVDEFERVGKDYFGIKIFIGDRGILDWFDGTIEELKAALVEELELEAKDKVTCPFCGRKIVRYVAMNKLKYCDCGAKIEIANYSVNKGNVTHMKRDIAFLK